MEFFTYTFPDMFSTIEGLIALKKMAEGLLNGEIIAPIILLFIFLSVIKIANEAIVYKKYEKIPIHVALLIAFAGLFLITGAVKVYNISLIKELSEEDVPKNISTFVETGRGTDRSVLIEEVPLMALVLSVPDEAVYLFNKVVHKNKQYSKEMLFPIETFKRVTIEYLLYGKDYVEGRIDKPKTVKVKEFKERLLLLSYCLDVPSVIRKIAEKEPDKNKASLYLKLANEIARLPNVAGTDIDLIVSRRNYQTKQDFCNWQVIIPIRTGVNRAIKKKIEYLKKIAEENNDESLQSIITFNDKFRKVNSGYIPVQLKYKLAEGLLASLDAVIATNNVYSHLHTNQNLLQATLDRAFSGLKTLSVTTINSRTFNEMLMVKIQGILIFVLFALLPFVIALSFLPVFGYNFKLLGSYVLAYFFVKLWMPVYVIAYDILTNRMVAEMIKYVLAPIIGTPVYASGFDIISFLAYSAQENETFNEAVLATLASVIPATLGAGGMLIFGKQLVNSSFKATSESLIAMQQLFGLGKKLISGLPTPSFGTGGTGSGGGGARASGGKSASSASPKDDMAVQSGNDAVSTITTPHPVGGSVTYSFKEDPKTKLWFPSSVSLDMTSKKIITPANKIL